MILTATVHRVQIYAWEGPAGTVRFLIPRALEIIAQRSPPHRARTLSYHEACEGLRINPYAKDLDFKYAMATDLTVPLIVATTPTGNVLIDGWHRLIKQVVTHTETVPVYFLTERETLESILTPDEFRALTMNKALAKP